MTKENEVNAAPEGKRFFFNPTISFDGVAIILACIGCSIWFGTLKETVRQQGETIRNHEKILQTLSESQRLQSEQTAIITTIINERLPKKQ